MSLTKGSNQKYSKRRTNVSTPSIVIPQSSQSGISLQGNADIDEFNFETMRFHVFGNVPSQVTLYLYGDLFNQNFYTEIGEHSHGPGSLSTGNVSGGSTSHNHSGSVTIGTHEHVGSVTSTTGVHSHTLKTEQSAGNPDNVLSTQTGTINSNTKFGNTDGGHSHSVSTANTSLGTPALSINNNSADAHSHTVTGGVSGLGGLAPNGGLTVRTSGTAKAYFDDLQITIDGIDRTVALLAAASLPKFGDGTSGNVIVVSGIELDLTSFITVSGEHKVVFSLLGGSPSNGGKIRYNLYTFA